ncbi:MAG: hypothetical protein PHS54_02625 [Clostridia bacterium]|nr:hypothetical protein [Clostridia bacterium]
MKKLLSILLILFIFPLGLIFSGCVPTVEEVAGIYKLVEVYDEEKTYKVGETLSDRNLTEDSAVLVLNNDKTFSATYTDLDFGGNIEGTWKKTENAVLFTSTPIKSVELNFEIKKDGDLFLMIEGESVLLLEKIEE